MTTAEAVAILDALRGVDPDSEHGLADQILLAQVDPKVRAAYERLIDRCDWWATA